MHSIVTIGYAVFSVIQPETMHGPFVHAAELYTKYLNGSINA